MGLSKILSFIQRGYGRFLEAQQVRMSSNFDGLILLSILGLICGLLAGGVIVVFRLFMAGAASKVLPGGDIDGFEGLSAQARFLLCVGGGLVVGLLLHALKPESRSFGVVHVIERLEYHQGNLPLKNAILQFLVASISIISGHSVGREGPSIHLGATSGSVLGRMLHVPNNSVRILVGSGVAAAIAAAFNTPLAGVIFAIEVVIMEYSVIGFAPVIIASVCATSLSRLTLGEEAVLVIPSFEMTSVQEIPVVALMGALIGCLSALFIQLTLFTTSLFANRAIWKRTLLAGIITGIIALWVPQIMGMGYDTVNIMLLAQISLTGVLLLTFAKVLASATAIGLGIPAGLIGPTLFIGAAAGGVFGLAGAMIFPNIAAPSDYAMLGMAAMMAATLQAPLAALIYLLELTSNPAAILPGMIAVVFAALVTRVVFGKSSIYRHLMLARGLDYRNTPMSMTLRRIGVGNVMERNFVQPESTVSHDQARELLSAEPRWIVLGSPSTATQFSILPVTDLALYLNEGDAAPDADDQVSDSAEREQLLSEKIDLLKIPAKRPDIAPITIISTLQEALEEMRVNDCHMLYVTGAHGESKTRIYGIVTREHIENCYRT